MDGILFSDPETHGLRVGQESAMKAIGVALAYVLRTAPLGQLERMSKGAPEHIVELCNLNRPCSLLLGYYKDGPQSSMERIRRSTKKAPPRRGYGDNERGRAKDHCHGSLLVRNIPMNCRHEELRVLFDRFGHPRAK